jgi:hypothetical protein
MNSELYQKIGEIGIYPGLRRGTGTMALARANFEEKVPEIFALGNSLLQGFRL